MRLGTAVLVGVVVLALAGAVIFGLYAGDGGDDVSLSVAWTSETGHDVKVNHHAVAAGRPADTGMVYAPVSGQFGTSQCALVALYGNGSRAWSTGVPPANCTIHAVADPTLADYDGDGTQEVLVATTERAVFAYAPLTGDAEFRYNLTSYGYSRPVVADLTGDESKEVVVVDAKGTVSVVRPNETAVWTHQLATYTWGQPAVADFDGDPGRELAVGIGGDGAVYLFEANGSVAWKRASAVDGSVTWMTTGQADDDARHEIVVATSEGQVAAFDGRGTLAWAHDFGELAAVHAFGDGDGDGTPEVYATAKDGDLRAIDASSGDVEWTTTLTTADVQMMPPPTLGDLDGDGTLELVAVSNDGLVSVVDPATGDVQARYSRDVLIYTHPTTADVDGDGRDEIFVMYSDGRVVALETPA